MQAVIFAGGLGTRISEDSHLRPKVMTEVAGMPILWHVMKYIVILELMILLFVVDTRFSNLRIF